MKLLGLILLVLCFCVDSSAQKVTPQKVSPGVTKTAVLESKNESSRYEILVSSNVVVRLDTFTGRTHYYTAFGFTSSNLKWILSKAEGLPDESSNLRSKYRIFAQESEDRGRYYFYLVNTETGQTWISNSGFKYIVEWKPFSDN